MTPWLATVAFASGALAPAAHAGVVAGGDSGLDAVYAPRRVAVVIGVQQYTDPALQGLRYAEADAEGLGAVLADDDIGGFDQVWVITGAQATTQAGIQQALDVATADLQRDDTFLLYLSGHGTLTLDAADGSRLWFLPSDGVLDAPSTTGIPVAGLEEQVNGLAARRRVLILDTCHNGRTNSKSALNSPTASLLDGLRGEPPAPRNVREVSESEARLFAAQYHQPAMEDPALGNGVYTHFLIQALTDQRRDADLDRDGLVDVAEAHDFARGHTMTHTGGMQVPRAEYRIVGHEEIYLAGDPSQRSSAEQALLTATDQILAGARLLVDGIPRGELPSLTAVEPGRRDVELQAADGRTLARQTLHLSAGETLPVESLFDQAGARWMVSAGAIARHGAASDAHLPFGAELELAWIRPVPRLPRLRPELHTRASWGAGSVADMPDLDPSVQAGEFAAGGSLGYGLGGASVGPLLEIVAPWRSFEADGGQHNQLTVTGATGARALWMVGVGPVDLGLRYDARWMPYRVNAEWTSMWHHGVAVGVSPRR